MDLGASCGMQRERIYLGSTRDRVERRLAERIKTSSESADDMLDFWRLHRRRRALKPRPNS